MSNLYFPSNCIHPILMPKKEWTYIWRLQYMTLMFQLQMKILKLYWGILYKKKLWFLRDLNMSCIKAKILYICNFVWIPTAIIDFYYFYTKYPNPQVRRGLQWHSVNIYYIYMSFKSNYLVKLGVFPAPLQPKLALISIEALSTHI